MNIRIGWFGAFVTTMKRARDAPGGGGVPRHRTKTASIIRVGATPSSGANAAAASTRETAPPVLLEQGLLAVQKPLTWTSQDVVARIRSILTEDAFKRGFVDERTRRKKPLIKVGHGGTLDPLASGVLVVGVGRGTSQLQSYLEGDKRYVAMCELGYETDTLDAEGRVVRTAPWNDIDLAAVQKIVPAFSGKIQQVPPLYSAIRVDGKRLYEIARKDPGLASADVEIPTREVEIRDLEVSARLAEDVVRSGVVDGPRYREAVQALEKGAVEDTGQVDHPVVVKAESSAAEFPSADSPVAIKAETPAVVKVESPTAVKMKSPSSSKPELLASVKVEAPALDNGNDKAIASNAGQEGKTLNRKNKKKQKQRGRNRKKANTNFKKSPFDERTVPVILPSVGELTLPRFSIAVRCGGGTYMRSLVRDMGYELGTVATMTGLVRTQQGPFVLADTLQMEDWTADSIYAAIRRSLEQGIGDAEGP